MRASVLKGEIIMSTLFEELGVTYREENGLFYPNISCEEDKDIDTGKYGDIWMAYLKEKHPERYRHYRMWGELRSKASEINEEAYEMLYGIMATYLATHIANDPKSTMENWKLREQAKTVAEEVVLHEIVYCCH